MLPEIDYLLLGIQAGLSNNVIPQLRAVALEFDTIKKGMFPVFFYDCEITEELREDCDDILEEVECHREEIIQLDFPKRIPIRGKLAYLRYEPILPEIKKENRAFLLLNTEPHAVYRLDMQEALLGKVTPALRYVSVGAYPDVKKLIAHFVYDGEISEFDHELATAAIQESRISLPEYEMDSSILRVDFPDDFPVRGDCLAYYRHEAN